MTAAINLHQQREVDWSTACSTPTDLQIAHTNPSLHQQATTTITTKEEGGGMTAKETETEEVGGYLGRRRYLNNG